MKLKYLLGLLILPIILGGCFWNKNQANQPAQPEKKYQLYKNSNLNGFSWQVKYNLGWQAEEQSTGKYKDFKDSVVFKGEGETISVALVDLKDQAMVRNSYEIKSESQTEVDSILANKISGSTLKDASDLFEAVLIPVNSYLLLIKTNKPESKNFNDFLVNLSIIRPEQVEKTISKSAVRLYFDRFDKQNADCQPLSYKEVVLTNPGEEIGLIPMAINTLIKLSQPDELQANRFYSAINQNSRLISFGYEDNKVIVNFNSYFNEGGGKCDQKLRRAQIEKTLMSLNTISNLKIKEVEIQVEDQTLPTP